MSQKVSANEIRVGNILEFKGKLWNVLKREHIKPGKGGAFVQVEMKSLKEETKLNHRFRSEESVIKAFIEEEEFQYLFHDGDEINLMNSQDFSQMSISKNILGEKIKFLTENLKIKLQKYNDEIIGIKLPDKVCVKISETEPYIKGQTVTSSYKSAKTANGLKIMVPPFIKEGDTILIDTEGCSYCERVE